MFSSTGGHISPAVTHHSQVWRLPPEVDPIAVSGLVLTQVGYNAGMRPTGSPGDAAVVLGDGMVGHWAAQTLAYRGARVLLAGRHEDRLSRFNARPTDLRVNISTHDLGAAVAAWAPGGIQAVIHTAGSLDAVESLMEQIRHNGHIVSAGFLGTNGAIDIQRLRQRELTLHAPAGWTRERMDSTLELVSRGVIKTLPLITHHFPVTEAGAAFDLVLNRTQPVLGVILDWQ